LSDIFREVEEDIRREQAKQIWDKYGLYILGAALALIIGVAAVVGWRAYIQSQNEDMSARYEAVAKAAETGSAAEAAKAFEELAKSGHGGYAALAQLREAAALQQAGEDEKAVAAYDALTASGKAPQILRDLAKVKAAFMLLDTASYDDIKARLMPLTGADQPWRNPAREALGLAAYKAQAHAEAQTYFAAIIEDNEAAGGLRDRAHVMQALLAPLLPKPDAKTDDATNFAPAAAAAGAKPE